MLQLTYINQVTVEGNILRHLIIAADAINIFVYLAKLFLVCLYIKLFEVKQFIILLYD